MKLNHQIATIGADIVEQLFPPQTSRLQALRQKVVNAPLFGSSRNHSFSTARIDISPVTEAELLDNLGYSGTSHINTHDDPMSISALLCLSHFMEETHPGEFYLGETREWCLLRPFSILLFRGTGPHGGTQPKPDKEARDIEKCINVILYPRKEFVNRTLNVLWPCYE